MHEYLTNVANAREISDSLVHIYFRDLLPFHVEVNRSKNRLREAGHDFLVRHIIPATVALQIAKELQVLEWHTQKFKDAMHGEADHLLGHEWGMARDSIWKALIEGRLFGTSLEDDPIQKRDPNAG